MHPVGEYLLALTLTLAVEVPAYLLGLAALRRIGPSSEQRRRLRLRSAIMLACGVNLVTHPILWWLFGVGPDWTRLPAAVPVAEVIVAVVEGLMVFAALRRDFGLLLLVALGANAASYGTGLIIQLASSAP